VRRFREYGFAPGLAGWLAEPISPRRAGAPTRAVPSRLAAAPDVVEVIGSTSWNMETRVAFRWSINGQVGQNRVETPAITMLLMGSDGGLLGC